MDYAPKGERARWKALDSVSSFGWCGSAAIGGVLSDMYGYPFTFVITIGMQAFATLGYCVLIPMVLVKTPEDVLNERSNLDSEEAKLENNSICSEVIPETVIIKAE